jgi:hypothetical protein
MAAWGFRAGYHLHAHDRARLCDTTASAGITKRAPMGRPALSWRLGRGAEGQMPEPPPDPAIRATARARRPGPAIGGEGTDWLPASRGFRTGTPLWWDSSAPEWRAGFRTYIGFRILEICCQLYTSSVAWGAPWGSPANHGPWSPEATERPVPGSPAWSPSSCSAACTSGGSCGGVTDRQRGRKDQWSW